MLSLDLETGLLTSRKISPTHSSFPWESSPRLCVRWVGGGRRCAALAHLRADVRVSPRLVPSTAGAVRTKPRHSP